MRTIRSLCAAVLVLGAGIIAAPTAQAGPYEDMLNLAPGGYGPDNCQPQPIPPESGGVLAAALCGPVPGGPSGAWFALHKNQNAMFSTAKKTYTGADFGPVPCPGAPDANPGRFGGGTGTVACGAAIGPVVMYTHAPTLFVGIIKGNSLEELFAFLHLTE